MKTKKLSKKLSLSKKTIANLNAREKNEAKGGKRRTEETYCWTECICPTATCEPCVTIP
jgi:hypothetical protein